MHSRVVNGKWCVSSLDSMQKILTDESDPNLLKPLYYVWVAITRTEQGAEYGLAIVNASTDIYFVEHFIAQHTIREQLQTTGFITGVPVEIAEQIKRKFAK